MLFLDSDCRVSFARFERRPATLWQAIPAQADQASLAYLVSAHDHACAGKVCVCVCGCLYVGARMIF